MKKKQTPKRKAAQRARHPNICAIASALGVSRHHLWSCLTGRRRGRPNLVEEYHRHVALAQKGGGQ